MIKKVSFQDCNNSINEVNIRAPHMVDIQKFNEFMINELDKICKIKGKKVLDLGASKYGHALVDSISKKVKEYVGIDLDIDQEIEVNHQSSIGKLLKMNAENLKFNDNYFDLIITVSTFEHFLNPDIVLSEMYRVLKSGGLALVTFGPIWSSSKGYHLHQYPNIAKFIPDWSHLFLSKKQMSTLLKNKNYPDNLDLSLEQVVNWIYKGNEINRIDVKKIKKYFEDSKFTINWITPLFDDDNKYNKIISKYLSNILPYTPEELTTRGFSILLSKN